MNFFDIKPESLPHDGQYYFNILIITIALSPEEWQSLIEDIDIEGLEVVWYTDEITSPEPTAYCLYQEEDIDEDLDFEITMYPHKVLEISSNGIAWYDMIDFDTEDPWSLDGEIEETES